MCLTSEAMTGSGSIEKDRSTLDRGTVPTLDFYMDLLPLQHFEATPVSTFSHVPLTWDFDNNIVEGLIVEVPYITEESTGATAFWLAVIVRKASYWVQLRWVGDCESGSEKYFWRHIGAFNEPSKDQLDTRVHPLGWAKAHNRRLKPPQYIHDFRLSWAASVEEEIRNSAGTLPEDFHETARRDNESCFERGEMVEATAFEDMSALKLAVVEGNVGGRIMLRYLDDSGIPKFCWFNEFSGMFMPCGWSRLHGRRLISTRDDSDAKEKKSMLGESSDGRASIYKFKPLVIAESTAIILHSHRFELDSKLEVIDPSEPQCIRVGTIVDVLKNGYLMIRIDGVQAPDGGEHRICLHASSPYLLPAGFAAESKLMAYFKPPIENFSYEGTKIVPREIFRREIPPHDFKFNQFLEAVGVWATNRIYVARIVRVVGHLVIVHFEGFDSRDDQFFPMSSPDLYPVGWCHLVGHRLLTPRTNIRTLRDDDDRGGHDRRMRRTGR